MKTKLTRSLILLTFIMGVFYGCKKTDKVSIKQDDGIAQIREKYKNLPLSQIQILNIPGKGYYGDINGNPITIPVHQNGMLGTSCPDPGDSEFSQVFLSMEREFTCGVGYRFVVTYKIISEFYITNGSGSNYSGGRIRLKNSAGTYYYTTPSANRAPLISLQNNGVVGVNSLGADLNEFVVSYRTEYISDAQFSSAVAIEPNLFAYTDCTNYATISIAFSPQQSAIGYQQNMLPCSRVDKVYWNPRSGATPPNLAGADPVGSSCFPWGYVYPHKQEIEFKNSSGIWKQFYLHINGLGNAGVATSLINYWDVWYIDVSASQTNNLLVPGNVEVRYRNNHMNGTGNGAPCVTQPANTWAYETWYIN